MTRLARDHYRSLSKERNKLKRQIKAARKSHAPSDRLIAKCADITLRLMRIETGQVSA